MPITNTFRTCNHTPDGKPDTTGMDWRNCYQCIDEICTQLGIARSYLIEIATADFTDMGDCRKPIAMPVGGRHFTQIAATALKHCS